MFGGAVCAERTLVQRAPNLTSRAYMRTAEMFAPPTYYTCPSIQCAGALHASVGGGKDARSCRKPECRDNRDAWTRLDKVGIRRHIYGLLPTHRFDR